MLNQPDLTLQEVCAQFKCTPPTVYRMINEGRLKSYLIGRSRRITFESVQTLREARS
jgi:excisionase family DNA binding protein